MVTAAHPKALLLKHEHHFGRKCGKGLQPNKISTTDSRGPALTILGRMAG